MSSRAAASMPGDADARLLARAATPRCAPPREVAAIREAFEEVGLLLADVGAADAGHDRGAGTGPRRDARWRHLVPGRRRALRPAIAHGPVGGHLPLGHAADHAPSFRRPLLRGRCPGRGGGHARRRRGRRARLAHPAGRPGRDGRGHDRDVDPDLGHAPAARARALDRGGRARLAAGEPGAIEVESVAADIVRVSMPAGGGVDGQPIFAYLVGRSRVVLVDPGDPTGPALERALAVIAERGGTLAGIALTQADPDHVAGAEGLAQQFDVPVFGGPGAGRDLPFEPTAVGEGSVIEVGDVPMRVIETPGLRPDHVAYLVGDGTRPATCGHRGRSRWRARRTVGAGSRGRGRARPVRGKTPFRGRRCPLVRRPPSAHRTRRPHHPVSLAPERPPARVWVPTWPPSRSSWSPCCRSILAWEEWAPVLVGGPDRLAARLVPGRPAVPGHPAHRGGHRHPPPARTADGTAVAVRGHPPRRPDGRRPTPRADHAPDPGAAGLPV